MRWNNTLKSEEKEDASPLEVQMIDFKNRHHEPFSQTDEERAKRNFTIVPSLIFNMISLYYLGLSLGLLLFEYTFNDSIKLDAFYSLDYIFIKYYPSVIIFCVIYAFLSVIFMYLSYKIKNGSSATLLLSILSCVVVPITVSYTEYNFLLPDLTSMLAKSLYSVGVDYLKFLLGFINPINVIYIALLLLLLSSRHYFRLQDLPILRHSKFMLTLLFVGLFFPVSIFSFYSYTYALVNDYGYKQAQKATSYYIYSPSFIPSEMDYATKFKPLQKFVTDDNGVLVVFDSFFSKSTEGKEKKIVLEQEVIDTNFDLNKFIDKYFKDIKLINRQNVSIVTAKDKVGIYIEDDSSNMHIFFITAKDSLIHTSAKNVPINEFKNFTELLK